MKREKEEWKILEKGIDEGRTGEEERGRGEGKGTGSQGTGEGERGTEKEQEQQRIEEMGRKG
jgi:hypothetical protein